MPNMLSVRQGVDHDGNICSGSPQNPMTFVRAGGTAVWVAAAVALAALIAAHPIAQSTRSIAIHVSETAGIRRNNYPAGTRVRFERGALADATHARLLAAGREVPVQLGAETTYADGSIEWLSVDFNVSLGPGESAPLELEYGGDVKQQPPAGGLT